jgi:hypothetical protein
MLNMTSCLGKFLETPRYLVTLIKSKQSNQWIKPFEYSIQLSDSTTIQPDSHKVMYSDMNQEFEMLVSVPNKLCFSLKESSISLER